MFGKPSIHDYDLTKKQNDHYHKWKDIQEKSEIEKIKKNPGRLISMKMHNIFDILGKEQRYFEKWLKKR
jgi:hypothetical protein